MSTVTQLHELDVVGWNDVLEEASLPSIVAPVFARRDAPERILFPPFRIVEDLVVGGTATNRTDWDELVFLGRASALESPVRARAEHELWLDLDGNPRYEPRRKAREHLKELAEGFLNDARKALAEGRVDDALRWAQQAFNANDRLVDPLAIKAAVRLSEGADDEVELLAELAGVSCSRKLFDQVIKAFVRSLQNIGLPQCEVTHALEISRLDKVNLELDERLIDVSDTIVLWGKPFRKVRLTIKGFPYTFTFFSFKGGVGRSLAALNCAYALAARGRRVLLIDLDLEAPGLSGYLCRQGELVRRPAGARDVLDLLKAIKPLALKRIPPAEAVRTLRPLSAFRARVKPSRVPRPAIVPAWRLDVLEVDDPDDYWKRLASLGLGALSRDDLTRMGLILREYLRQQRVPLVYHPLWKQLGYREETPYDYVLADSRTGITEFGGLYVGPFPDRLVVFTGLND